MSFFYTHIITRFGDMIALAQHNTLVALYRGGQKHEPIFQQNWIHKPQYPLFLELQKQLHQYIVGKRIMIDCSFSFKTGTVFQQQVWQVLSTIPYGHTVSYQWVAQAIKRPHAVRAVASAIAKNPLLIIVPCHRVIGKNGTLTGYAAGIAMKKHLLQLEAQSNSSYDKY